MAILPPFIEFVILNYWSIIRTWLSERWYSQLLARYQDHWLVKVKAVLDFGPFEQACAGFHLDNGWGSPITYPVGPLVRVLLVKYLLNLSYRETEQRLACDLLVRWFAGYGLFEPTPSHMTVWRFELWVFSHQRRFFFDEVLRQADRYYPQEHQSPQLVDTFAMIARGAKTSHVTLVRGLCRRLLNRLAKVDPTGHAAILSQLDPVALFGQKGDRPTAALSPEQQAERLQIVGQQALKLHRLVTARLAEGPSLPPPSLLAILEWLAAIDKVLTDEATITIPDPAQPDQVIITELPLKQKGHYRLGCANDLTATYRVHANALTILGYNPAVLSSLRFIREIVAQTGSLPDPSALLKLLENQLLAQGLLPGFLISDQAFGTGKTRALLHALTDGQTQLVALLPDYEKRSDKFPPSRFTLSDDGLALTCPNGLTSTTVSTPPDRDGLSFRFSAKQCQGCPLWNQCRGPDAKPTARRSVFISHFRSHLEAALEFNRSDDFKALLKHRPLIERFIFNLTHFFGARRCRATGLDKADFQLKLAATAFNLRQLIRCLTAPPPPAAHPGPESAS
jgi:hypothetical protein